MEQINCTIGLPLSIDCIIWVISVYRPYFDFEESGECGKNGGKISFRLRNLTIHFAQFDVHLECENFSLTFGCLEIFD